MLTLLQFLLLCFLVFDLFILMCFKFGNKHDCTLHLYTQEHTGCFIFNFNFLLFFIFSKAIFLTSWWCVRMERVSPERFLLGWLKTFTLYNMCGTLLTELSRFMYGMVFVDICKYWKELYVINNIAKILHFICAMQWCRVLVLFWGKKTSCVLFLFFCNAHDILEWDKLENSLVL